MKKKLLFAIHYLEIGGAEMSLIGLLQALDYTKYDVDLFVYSHRGELMGLVPKEVNLLPEIEEYAQIECPIKDVAARGYLRIALARMRAKWDFNNYAKRKQPKDGSAIYSFVFKNVTPLLPAINLETEYDLAVSFLTPHNIVLEKVWAKRKACWIHTDYSKIDVNEELEQMVWSDYDYVVSISDAVTKAFVKVFPSLGDKIVRIDNILLPRFVCERAAAFVPNDMPKEENTINLLSVGRFSYAKNYDNVPDICRRINHQLSLENCPFSVKWYLIGYGGDEELIRQRIKDAGMEGQVILLGKRTNPYPYMTTCDIYVQPSRYEGNAVTVREAQMLGKPVVATDYQTVRNQIENGVDGVIVPLENEECAKGIAAFIMDKKKQRRIAEYLERHDYGNVDEARKVEMLLK